MCHEYLVHHMSTTNPEFCILSFFFTICLKGCSTKFFNCVYIFCRELGETVDSDELSLAVENVFKFEAALAAVRIARKPKLVF